MTGHASKLVNEETQKHHACFLHACVAHEMDESTDRYFMLLGKERVRYAVCTN